MGYNVEVIEMKFKVFHHSSLVSLLTLAILLGPGVSEAALYHQVDRLLYPKAVVEAMHSLFLPMASDHYCANFTTASIVPRPAHFPPSAFAGQFSYPEDCRTGLQAGSPIPVNGVASNVPEEANLWVFVYAGNEKYYPQCNNALIGDCGVFPQGSKWSVTVYLGRKGIKERFHLALLELDQIANDELTQKMKTWAEMGFFPGIAISELDPYIIKELDAIQVETAGQ